MTNLGVELKRKKRIKKKRYDRFRGWQTWVSELWIANMFKMKN